MEMVVEAMDFRQKRTELLHPHRCLKCGFEWASAKQSPRACVRCKTYHWQIPHVRKRREGPATEFRAESVGDFNPELVKVLKRDPPPP